MGKGKKQAMSFRQAVEATPDIASGFKEGLKAMGDYSKKVSVANTSLIEGSVDIDSCTSKKYPSANRWDYAFSYHKEVFFVEVHTANTREVDTVLRKLQWLKDWLNNDAPEMNKLKASTLPPFYWIQSKGFAIPKTSSQYRRVISQGLKPINKLVLK